MSVPANPFGARFARLTHPSHTLALRALAHPLRLKLHALVGREGSITAAEAARQLGVSQALASHHLRQLAKYGYVEPAEAGDNRERPWRVTHTSTTFEPEKTDEAQGAVEARTRSARMWDRRRPRTRPIRSRSTPADRRTTVM